MAKQSIPQLPAEPRTQLGTRTTRRLRATGKVPAVIYGHQQQPAHVQVDSLTALELVKRHTHVVELSHEGVQEPCLIKDVQWDHLGSTMIHLDFARIDLSERVKVEVQVTLTGEAIGLKEAGAFLEQPLTVVEIECLATDIPEKIVADVSALGVDESFTVAQLKLPEGVKLVTDGEKVVATIQIGQELDETTLTPAAEGAEEPEVIGRKPDEEGAEEGAEPEEKGKEKAKDKDKEKK
ncbi:MAG: 50S ribosomal protein L25 [Phycisphaeraceae bacterium]|nr:50S ribosomal protein L25 [Phycisphaeraceae bacterium]